MRFVRALTAAVLLGAVLATVPAAAPASVRAVGPLPDCRLDDILTEPRGYDDWATTQVDWILTLGPDYKPPDLVLISSADVAGGGLIRKVAIDDLRAMGAAARKNGSPIKALSPFRSYKQQVALFKSYAGADYHNFDSAITYSARPGHSEHQTGLTIDFGSVGDTGLTSNWEVTKAGGWMARNAWKYGWLMSYPDGKKDLVCYRYEPWHYRYVGRDLASKIHDSGLTIREYLWANYTQVDPACVALPAPKITTPGVPRSCAFAVASPSAPPATPVPTAIASDAPGTPPVASPGASAGPSVPAGAPQGLDPAVLIAGGLLVAAVVALVYAVRRARPTRGR
ncbi:MAG: D-alanyl-D-alanine carboxypeptidase family protein [Chloroflexota bacterium]